MRRWAKIALGDICTPVERFVTPTAGTTYRQLGVRLWGEGAYEREMIDGADTKYSKFNRVETNDLVVNKIWARNGSVAVATEKLAGTHVSGEFPTFALDSDRADPRWVRLITKWRGFWTLCDEKAQGTSGKNRIKPSQFLEIHVPLPPILEQQAIVSRIDTLADKARQVNEHLAAIEHNADRLLAVRFRAAITDAPFWPMAEMAPAIRRSVTIDIHKRYREVGARSFGKGLFVKPDFYGADATWQKPVWINAGDVVLSNIKAWEGAIAVAGAEHDGCISSHRYITCVPRSSTLTAGFLQYFLLSDEGLEKIGFASPGTADRNRTLSLTNLGKIEVPTPPLTTQYTFDAVQTKIAALKARHATIRQANDALIPATLERIFSGVG